ncbi:hypothetical protein ZWY2020_051793 [Hordeum vulgare]|nr:hypothetical protein ZWY2020_051793 [Hordeum vulgare]
MRSGGPGDPQDGGGAKGFFAHVLEDEVAFDQVSVLVSADPGAEGEGSSAQACGGEISSSIPDDGKTFVEPRQTSRDTKSTRPVRDSFLAAAIVADGTGPDSVPKMELQAGYVAQPGSRRPDDAQEVCQEDSNIADLPIADKGDDQMESNSVVRQEGHQADSKFGSDSVVRAFLKTARVGFPRQQNTRAPRVPSLRPPVMTGKDAPAPPQHRALAASQQVSGSRGPLPRLPPHPVPSAAKSGAGGVQAASRSAEPGGHAGGDVNRMQPRGRWGDDGVNAYSAGQHRGSSSQGGGRGYAWQSNAGSGQGFSGPSGNFVPGPAGPKRGGYRGRWGGRGGGRRLPPNVVPVAVDKESAQKPDDIPLTATIGGVASTVAVDKDIVPPRIEGADRPTKWARPETRPG